VSGEVMIFFEILISFFAVVGIVYLCTETGDLIKYGREKLCIPVTIDSADYSYEQILLILKAFSTTTNNRAASFLFDQITILTSEEECEQLTDFLGKYASYADIRKRG